MSKKGWCSILLILWAGLSYCQVQPPVETVGTGKVVKVKEVFIIGNQKTKSGIILREMQLIKGTVLVDTLIAATLEQDRQRIYNTNLFNEVDIQPLYASSDELMILVSVTERWYIYPSFIFKLADRNLNDWWVNQNRDLSRVNLGVRYQQYNFRGRRELLNLIFQMGFERDFLASWRIPYIEKSQKHGLEVSVSYSESRNAGYRTEDHVRQFISEDRLLRKSTRSALTYRFRKSYYNLHRVRVTFDHKSIDDTVAMLNPNFFGNGATLQRHFDITYRFTRDLRNNNNYATKGHYLDVRMEKTGLGIYNQVDIFDVNVTYRKYFDLGKQFSISTGVEAFSSWPKNQPYSDYSGVGFNQTLVRGYEQDLIEGHQYFLYKSTLRRRLFKHTQDLGKLMPLRQFRKVPIAVYGKIFFDGGWVNNYPQYELSERLTNKHLYGMGAGFDIVSIYDLVSRFEWSMNAEGNIRFAISAKADL